MPIRLNFNFALAQSGQYEDHYNIEIDQYLQILSLDGVALEKTRENVAETIISKHYCVKEQRFLMTSFHVPRCAGKN